MKKQSALILIIASVFFMAYPAFSQDLDKVKTNNHTDTVSYIIGYDIGNNLKTQGIEVNVLAMAKGLMDAVMGTKSVIPEDEKMKIMNAFQQEMAKKMEEKQKGAKEENKKKGNEFLENNKKNKGVVVTASGLQYEVLKEGTGKSPKATDEVTVNYEGKLIDGKVFDSSYERGQPITFPLNGVIPGWTEGLQLMKEGAKFRFWIPSDLAYGDQGAGGSIPPGATLIFEVELISVQVK